MLPHGCVVVYLCDSILTHAPGAILSEGLSRLPEHVVRRIKRIRNHDDAIRSCFGELLCRIGISESIGIPWDRIPFRAGTHGKPLYAGDEQLWFSVTHSGHWVGCAVARSPVGLDIERIRSLRSALPRRVLSPSEYEYFAGFPEKHQPLIFIRQWCLKESLLKAKGTGFATRWRAVSIRLDNDPPIVESPLLPFPIQFRELDTEPDYRCALCIFGTLNTIRISRISPEKLYRKLKLMKPSHTS